ncbi:MAG: hypothetical protein KDE22_12915 [Rhodobacterales bacterium]|nr:hypothetical protein [Rhodobacterales bacterium]
MTEHPLRPAVYDHPAAWPRRLVQRLQALGARGLLGLLRLLPLDLASALGGALGRGVGPRLGISRRARRNLVRAFPDLRPREVERIVTGMWDNLGRTLFEFPHMDRLTLDGSEGRVQVVGLEHARALRDGGRAALFVGGHLGNWEIYGRVATLVGMPVHLVYRAPNNPYMDPLFRRRGAEEGEMIPKGATGARRVMALLKRGQYVGMLVDQKMNDGIAVPFFGRPAMTAPAVAQFALRDRLPVVPVRIERVKGAHFRVTVEAPFDLPDGGDRAADTLALMTAINARLESWIRERPDQWLWLHNRWPE